MEYSLYRLNFTTAVHIGRDTGGASLDDGQMTIHADTVFSALCCEAARYDQVDRLVQYFGQGSLIISDALPYAGDELFLPKPVLFVDNRKREGDSTLKKALKNLPFIPLSRFPQYVGSLTGSTIDLEDLKVDFGILTTDTRVAIKGNTPPLPYHVASWKFAPDCGLYIIVGYNDESALALLERMLSVLGLSGIGGKKTSGLGKFNVQKNDVPVGLLDMIQQENADYHMMLGTGLPRDENLDQILGTGWYALVRRGGFIHSDNYAAAQMKKRSMFMLGPGSCLRQRFQGGMHDLSDDGSHPVYRNASTLFVGVSL